MNLKKLIKGEPKEKPNFKKIAQKQPLWGNAKSIFENLINSKVFVIHTVTDDNKKPIVFVDQNPRSFVPIFTKEGNVKHYLTDYKEGIAESAKHIYPKGLKHINFYFPEMDAKKFFTWASKVGVPNVVINPYTKEPINLNKQEIKYLAKGDIAADYEPALTILESKLSKLFEKTDSVKEAFFAVSLEGPGLLEYSLIIITKKLSDKELAELSNKKIGSVLNGLCKDYAVSVSIFQGESNRTEKDEKEGKIVKFYSKIGILT